MTSFFRTLPDDVAPPRRPRRTQNPWQRAVGVIAIVLLIVGALVGVGVLVLGGDLFLVGVGLAAGGLALAGGLAAGLCYLVLGALEWSRATRD